MDGPFLEKYCVQHIASMHASSSFQVYTSQLNQATGICHCYHLVLRSYIVYLNVHMPHSARMPQDAVRNIWTCSASCRRLKHWYFRTWLETEMQFLTHCLSQSQPASVQCEDIPLTGKELQPSFTRECCSFGGMESLMPQKNCSSSGAFPTLRKGKVDWRSSIAD